MDSGVTTQIAFGTIATILALVGIYAAYRNRNSAVPRLARPTLPLHAPPPSKSTKKRSLNFTGFANFISFAKDAKIGNLLSRIFRSRRRPYPELPAEPLDARQPPIYELPAEPLEVFEMQQPTLAHSHDDIPTAAGLTLPSDSNSATGLALALSRRDLDLDIDCRAVD